MASSEPSTSRLPEEDSTDMDSDSVNEVSQINIDSQISTSIRSSKSAKMCVYLRQCAKTFPWATTLRKGSSFAFCMKCSRDINLGRGGLEISGDNRKKLHKHSEKDGVGYCLYSPTLGQ